MKVMLRKVTSTPLDFVVKSNDVTFKGYLEYYKGKLILLKANVSGPLLTQCDICANEIAMKVDENIEYFISDGLYEDDGGVNLDVVESFDGSVDIEELLNSEIELIKSDYHSCENCK